jgi:hypothetical protein
MTRRNPFTIPYFILALGIGLMAYYGDQLYRFEPLSENQLEEQVDQQVIMFMDQRGPHLSRIEGERLQQLRDAIRAEIVARHEAPKEKAQVRFFIGLGALIISFGNFVMAWFVSRQM